jgi:hypothetical protein
MVQLKYFGDDRDYFKYDLITTLVSDTSLRHYVFVPMLTEHRQDNEGNQVPKPRIGKRGELLNFIKSCNGKSLAHWERWLAPHVASYRAIDPVDRTIFSNDTRDNYWSQVQPLLKQKETLIFLDPDTGLQLGRKSAIHERDWPKYILDNELGHLIENLHPTSALLVYQHLPRNMHWHVATVDKKIARTRERFGLYASAYREGDLAFIAMTKSERVRTELDEVFADYHQRSDHRFKSLHCAT